MSNTNFYLDETNLFSVRTNNFECNAEFVPSSPPSLSTFSCLHLNARSIKNKEQFNNLLLFLEGLEYKFGIIVITESWLSNNDPLDYYSIPSYDNEFFVAATKEAEES